MKQRFSVVLALVFTFALFSGVMPAYGAETTVDIKDMANTDAIKAAVETGLQNNDTVTVITSGDAAYDTKGEDLKLLVPTGKKILWKADYTGEIIDSEALLFLAGGGTIEVSDCDLICTGAGSVLYQGNGDVIVSGESQIKGNNIAIASNGNISIQGGSISSEKGVGAVMCYGKFTMTGGTIYAAEGYAISGEGISSTINISGGFVFAQNAEEAGADSAHGLTNSEIDKAITLLSGEAKIEGTAVVAVWNTLSGATEYVSGTADNLTVYPERSTVWWLENGVSGIRYNNSTFFPFDKITAKDPFEVPSVNDGPAPDANTNATITVAIVGGVIVLVVVLFLVVRLTRKRKIAADSYADKNDGNDVDNYLDGGESGEGGGREN